jgi:hypothetical protein
MFGRKNIWDEVILPFCVQTGVPSGSNILLKVFHFGIGSSVSRSFLFFTKVENGVFVKNVGMSWFPDFS